MPRMIRMLQYKGVAEEFSATERFESEGDPSMTTERLVVVGGDAAGMSAAAQAKRRRPELEIIVFERSPHVSYSA